ncbi:MAG: amidohydrolase family protein, partial [Candidatus Asgardarchaeia archaeon]
MGQSLLIFGGTIVTMNPKRGVLEDGAIYIEGDRIKAIGNSKDIRREYSADIEINAKGKIVIPGLVNAHTHSAQTLLRGLGDDMNLFEWLTKIIYPIAKNLTPEYVHIGSKVAFMEMVRFGITTVIDNHKDLSSKEAIIRVADAAQEVGIRAVIARGVRDWVPRCEKWEIPRFTVPYTPEEEMK